MAVLPRGDDHPHRPSTTRQCRPAPPGRVRSAPGDADQHLAFGKGLHYCLGGNPGRLEAQIAITQLANRYRRLQLTPGQRLTFDPNISFRGPQVLRVQSHGDPSIT
jgi:cytochrome P450